MNFALKHLPPSAGRPRALALDRRAAASLEGPQADLFLAGPGTVHFLLSALPFRPAAFDAVLAASETVLQDLNSIHSALRPGGRLIALVPVSAREAALSKLARGGFIHLYAEEMPEGVLVRGERPPEAGSTLERVGAVSGREGAAPLELLDLATADLSRLGRSLHLLVTQTPNKPAWRLAPGESVEWRAVATSARNQGQAAPAFTSLVKAVQFMQAAVLAGRLSGINKVGKFPLEAARDWPFRLLLNPAFDEWQKAGFDTQPEWVPVNRQTATLDEE